MTLTLIDNPRDIKMCARLSNRYYYSYMHDNTPDEGLTNVDIARHYQKNAADYSCMMMASMHGVIEVSDNGTSFVISDRHKFFQTKMEYND